MEDWDGGGGGTLRKLRREAGRGGPRPTRRPAPRTRLLSAASRRLLPLPYLNREATLRDIQLLRAAIPRRTDSGCTRRK